MALRVNKSKLKSKKRLGSVRNRNADPEELKQQALEWSSKGIPGRARALLEQAFLKGYQTTRTDVTRDPMAGIDAWTFLSIVRHLYIAWRIPERRDVLPALLDACESSARELR